VSERGREYAWTGGGPVWEERVAPCPWIEEANERCRRLRFTGRLELIDELGEVVLWQNWSAGEVVGDYLTGELMAGRLWYGDPDARRCAGVRIVQCIPGLDGGLMGGPVLRGALEPGAVPRILALCREHRLGADVVLRGPRGHVAEVGVSDGAVESATIEPALDLPSGSTYRAVPATERALAELSRWTRGSFELRLRPLFGGDPAA
jgi:hypothetical protein